MRLAIGTGEEEGAVIVPWYDSGSGQTPAATDLAFKRFVFADGTELTLEDILALADGGVIGYQNGTDGDDSLRGSV
jgi:hypothetical protein